MIGRRWSRSAWARMPELPEVEVVRRGLDDHLVGRRLTEIDVRHPRAVRHSESPLVVEQSLRGARVTATGRRGKYLWLGLSGGASDCLLVHLGMSGQMLLKDADVGAEDAASQHLRIRARLSDGRQLWFVDQRTFGYWRPDNLQAGAPASVAHIAPDPFETAFDLPTVARRIKTKRTEVKRCLLNQEIVSGIGNIYADEALWAAQVHPRQRADRMSLARIEELLVAAREVMGRALAQGGTSFDSLYVNVNGGSGYFARALNVYGHGGQPCPRCGAVIVREVFTNRSSHLCARCQARH